MPVRFLKTFCPSFIEDNVLYSCCFAENKQWNEKKKNPQISFKSLHRMQTTQDCVYVCWKLSLMKHKKGQNHLNSSQSIISYERVNESIRCWIMYTLEYSSASSTRPLGWIYRLGMFSSGRSARREIWLDVLMVTADKLQPVPFWGGGRNWCA